MRDTQAKGEACSLQRAWCRTSSQDPRIMPWARGRCSTVGHPGVPGGFNLKIPIWTVFVSFFQVCVKAISKFFVRLGASQSDNRKRHENREQYRHTCLAMWLSAMMSDSSRRDSRQLPSWPVISVSYPHHGFHLVLFSQLTYRDWLQLELEIQPEFDSLSDMER